MRQNKRGFTLLETILTLAIAAVILAAAAFLLPNIFTLNRTADNLAQAQSLAQMTMWKIEEQLRYANTVDISTSLPTTPSADYHYIYLSDSSILHRYSGNTIEYFSPATSSFPGFTYGIAFSRTNDKVIQAKITVYKNGEVFYSSTNHIFANNLLSKSITGSDLGGCIAYQLTLHDSIAVSSITVNSNSSSITQNGQTMQMTVSILPANATEKGVAWSVDNPDYASISADGLLTPLKNGTVTVMATALDGSGTVGTKQIMISNQTVVITGLSLTTNTGNTRMNYNGSTLTIIPIFTPSTATNKTITWSVDNTLYATIDSNGVLTSGPYKNVSVVVTARTNDGSNLMATIEILIKN